MARHLRREASWADGSGSVLAYGQGPRHLRSAHGLRVAGALGRLRARLNREDDHRWCPGTGTQVSTGATEHGLASCPLCPKRIRTKGAPMARYRIIGEHTR